VSNRFVVAIDGGNSKTDVAFVSVEGALLAHLRGPLSSPHHLGIDGSLELLERLRREAAAAAGVGPETVAEVAALCMAGVDFPSEEQALRAAVEARGWAARVAIANDTFAVLRAGTERGWGVAVVCGAGINCTGVSPDGRHARFLSLGAISGDWGGGYDVGLAAVSAAARSEDGRGPTTTLERSVPRHFGLTTPSELAEAIHLDHVNERRVVELAPLVLAEAEHDEVAAGIVNRLADEVVALARAALQRLHLTNGAAEVLLGGGLLQAGDGRLLGAIEAGLREVGPDLVVRPAGSPPIVGAALLALDEIGAGAEAQARVRSELGAATGRSGADDDADDELTMGVRHG
jgi:N-acetylglucosamine kinase-like BadF-type ATPase